MCWWPAVRNGRGRGAATPCSSSAACCGLRADASDLTYARRARDDSGWLPAKLHAPPNEVTATTEAERLVLPPDQVADDLDAGLGEIILLGHHSDSEESEREGLAIL
eukprot:2295834-Prymnesium_polylepis.1